MKYRHLLVKQRSAAVAELGFSASVAVAMEVRARFFGEGAQGLKVKIMLCSGTNE